MKHLLFLISIITVSFGYGQNNEWKLLESKSNVNIYAKLQTCIVPADAMDSDYYLIKIENNNSVAVDVIWKIDKWYDGRCYTCNTAEYTGHTFKIPANKYIEGECGRNKTENLKVYVKHNNFNTGTKFTKFTIAEFTVNTPF